MNREIKFRAWDKEEEVLLCDISIQNDTWDMLNEFFEHFDELIFMQCTGMKDKNNVEIYESDIVEVAEHHFDMNGNFNGYYRVEWNEESLTYLAGNLLLFRLKPYITVIGNIHEDPELLKGGMTC